jgi:hypothetical protein
LPEDHGVQAPASSDEYEFAPSAQAVDGEKHLVPRQIGAAPRDVFKVAGPGSVHEVKHLIFHGRMVCHRPPFGKQNVLLEVAHCMVGATGWSGMKAEGEVQSHNYLQS